MSTNWETRLEQACTNRRFREFVQRNVLDWCKWKLEESLKLALLQQAPAEETPAEQDARWAAADELESNPRFRPAAVADDPRLTLDAKCILTAIWWYRKRTSTALCLALKPAADTMSATAPLQVILRTLDIAPDRAAIEFTDIGAIAVEVLAAFDGVRGCTTWQDVAERLERLQKNGEQYTSRHDFAKRLSCSPSVIQRAVKETPSLHVWAKFNVAPAPKVQSLTQAVSDNTVQRCEPNPADLMTYEDAQTTLRKLIKEAPPETRAKLQKLSSLPCDELRRIMKPYADSDDLGDRILGHRL